MAFARPLAALTAAATAAVSLAIVHDTGVTPTVGALAVTAMSGSGVPHDDHVDVGATPAATVAPAPVQVLQQAASTPVPVPAPVRPRPPLPRPPAPAPAAPAMLRNLVTSGDGTLHTGVGVYGDCTGQTPLTHAESAIDSCIPGPLYFVGHNVGVFTPLMHMGVGATITYYDGSGTGHAWRVVSVRSAWHSADGVPSVTQGDVVAQFQTCVVPDGSVDRILDVVPA
jgi:hypothetical protein